MPDPSRNSPFPASRRRFAAGSSAAPSAQGHARQAKDLRSQSEGLAAAWPPLLLAAERVANSFAQGLHGRRRIGPGETFWQFRSYDPGDRPQMIDWRQSAKSDRIYVREMEWEAAQSAWFWVDGSRSMDWCSDGRRESKRERAILIALALASLLLRGGENVAPLEGGGTPGRGRQALVDMAIHFLLQSENAAARDESVTPSNLPPPQALPRYGQLLLFSDFLSPLDALAPVLQNYAEQGVYGLLCQVLDPAELTLPYKGRVLFEDLEGPGDWLASRTEALRDDYLQRLERHQAGLQALARGLGWRLVSHNSAASPHEALMALYVALEARNETLR
jgi:uncharacterized protein (DUF58 family)